MSNTVDDLVTVLADYRYGEIDRVTEQQALEWLEQFPKDEREILVDELTHVLKQTFVTREAAGNFLANLPQNESLASGDLEAFWNEVTILQIQNRGLSQVRMNEQLIEVLHRDFGFYKEPNSGNESTFIFIDDGLFTGSHIYQDVANWIRNSAPYKCVIHIIVMALHSYGYWNTNNRLKDVISESGKDIRIKFWRSEKFEDRKKYTYSSDVLRPVELPKDPRVTNYVKKMKYKPHFRPEGSTGTLGLFSSLDKRRRLETILLKAGAKVLEVCTNFDAQKRPLGHSGLETLGFGSLFMTFQNCPNNAPLALWAGEPWIPLLPRRTNTDSDSQKAFDSLQ